MHSLCYTVNRSERKTNRRRVSDDRVAHHTAIRFRSGNTLTDCRLPTRDTKDIKVTTLCRYGLNGPHAPGRELIIKSRR